MEIYAVFYKNEFVATFEDRKVAYKCAKELGNKYGREYSVREHFMSKQALDNATAFSMAICF